MSTSTDTSTTSDQGTGTPPSEGQNGSTTGNADTGKPADLTAEVEKWKGLARKHEQDAKTNKEKATQFDALQAANMSEQEKAAAAQKELEARATTAEGKALRYEAAAAAGLPLEFAARLQGSTLEELTADAKTLLPLVGKQTSQQVNLDGGPRGDAPQTPEDSEAWLRRQVKGS